MLRLEFVVGLLAILCLLVTALWLTVANIIDRKNQAKTDSEKFGTRLEE
jgi:hypothetical protein